MKQGCFYFFVFFNDTRISSCWYVATDLQMLLTALTFCVKRRHWRQWVLSHNALLKAQLWARAARWSRSSIKKEHTDPWVSDTARVRMREQLNMGIYSKLLIHSVRWSKHRAGGSLSSISPTEAALSRLTRLVLAVHRPLCCTLSAETMCIVIKQMNYLHWSCRGHWQPADTKTSLHCGHEAKPLQHPQWAARRATLRKTRKEVFLFENLTHLVPMNMLIFSHGKRISQYCIIILELISSES